MSLPDSTDIVIPNDGTWVELPRSGGRGPQKVLLPKGFAQMPGDFPSIAAFLATVHALHKQQHLQGRRVDS